MEFMEILDVVRQSRINRQVYTCSDQFNVLFPFFFSHSFHWFSSSQSRTRRVMFFRTDLRSGTMHTLKYRFGSAIQSILVVSKKIFTKCTFLSLNWQQFLRFLSIKGKVKCTQHLNATFCNFVMCNVLHEFGHPVAAWSNLVLDKA